MEKRVKEAKSEEEEAENSEKNLRNVFSYVRAVNPITLLDLRVACRLQIASIWPGGHWSEFPSWLGSVGGVSECSLFHQLPESKYLWSRHWTLK